MIDINYILRGPARIPLVVVSNGVETSQNVKNAKDFKLNIDDGLSEQILTLWFYSKEVLERIIGDGVQIFCIGKGWPKSRLICLKWIVRDSYL